MKKLLVTGKSIEEAVQNGLRQWNTTEDRVKIVVLEQPSRGLFGLIGTRDAKVELELIPDAVEETIYFLQDVFRTMKLEVRIEKSWITKIWSFIYMGLIWGY